jgi:hypothetical protein
MATEPNAPARAGTDPLKWYCIIFLVLVVLLTGLYFMRRSDRKALESANATADAWFKPSYDTRQDRPADIPNLAFEVEQYAEAFEASGGESENVIKLEKMDALATHAGLTRTGTHPAPIDQNRSRGYQTIAEGFDYQAGASLENLIVLAFNVERQTRYRVMEMDWALMSDRDGNNVPPFNKIGRSKIKVAMRMALRKAD